MNNFAKSKWTQMSPIYQNHPKKDWVRYLARRFSIDPIIMHWLFLQGVDSEEKICKILFPSYEDFHDSFLLNDMKKALFRIIKAIKRKEKILVFGDYDGDGITATTIIVKALRYFNADVAYRLPLRKEGYGINENSISEIAAQQVGLIVTVDNGSSAHPAIEKAKAHGIDVIVSDHHDILQGHPNCVAFINPKREDNTYPFNDLCGAGVALKMVQGLFQLAKLPWHKYAAPYIELATIGTIADLVSLTNENRTICNLGIRQMNLSPQPNLRKLFKVLKINYIDSSTIAFSIAPILNAVGRIHDPNVAVKLLIEPSTTENELRELVSFNQQRKQLTLEQYSVAEEEILKKKFHEQSVIVVQGNYEKGIIGIIASRISENFKRPSIVISACGTGSCRGVNGSDFSMINTLERCSDYFSKYGGHKAAAGFSISLEDINSFRKAVIKSADLEGPIQTNSPYLSPLSLNAFNSDMLMDLETLEPFGMGFPKPIFLLGPIVPFRTVTFGQFNEHLKVYIEKKEFLGFSLGKYVREIEKKKICLLFTPNSNKKNSFLIHDFKFHDCENQLF